MLAVMSRPGEAVCMRRALDTLSALVSAIGVFGGVASAMLSQRPRMLMMSFGDSEATLTVAGAAGLRTGDAGRLSTAAI